MRKSIPDLQADKNEITLEHCYVLVDRLGIALDLIEGTPGAHKEITDAVNPELLKDHFEEHFVPDEFCRLFKTELGKGVLVGTYAKALMEQIIKERFEE